MRTYPRVVPGPQRVRCANLVLEALALLRHAGSLIPEEEGQRRGSDEAHKVLPGAEMASHEQSITARIHVPEDDVGCVIAGNIRS